MSTLKVNNLKFLDRGPYTFEVKGGEIMCLHGQSGSGKTLLLRALADLDPIDGNVYFDHTGVNEIAADKWRSLVRYIPAESHWWFETVGEHFRDEENVLSLLDGFGFENEVLTWKIHRLSTGEKQRLALLRALNDSPRSLLLDEPTASLDKTNITRVEKTILSYIKQNKIPTIWVSHDPTQIDRIASFRAEISVGGKMRIQQ